MHELWRIEQVEADTDFSRDGLLGFDRIEFFLQEILVVQFYPGTLRESLDLNPCIMCVGSAGVGQLGGNYPCRQAFLDNTCDINVEADFSVSGRAAGYRRLRAGRC